MQDSLFAIIYAAKSPDEYQKQRIAGFLQQKYHKSIILSWEEAANLKNGFRIEVGTDVYDWSAESRLQQLAENLRELAFTDGDIIPLMRDAIKSFTPQVKAKEYGSVKSVGDGIASIAGLDNVAYGEILEFEDGTKGMVLDLSEKSTGCVIFGDDKSIHEGSSVMPTGRLAGMPVGEGFIGRVVNALGEPLDEKGAIKADDYFPMEAKAPGITQRQPVNTPLETGILAIDSMFPIGRGQRELIIGDRQTGKTAIAVDTILNQKGKDVICIYVAIGQKASSVAKIAESLRKLGAMDYTTIVCATSSDSAPMQYIAPYAGCAMGEYFMKKGKDVLIVYDDLSKHATAYRTISLLLERSPGREAYPGDVFYLHSRLLERSAHLSDDMGGGSMTALPIVETQAGDVSAYIPTNIISITDGQIFLESDRFFAGQRPAVNIGLSVSRVGGAAQTKAMKKATGAIRLDLAQYREMEVFTQFSSDLDSSTKQQLEYGRSLMELLKQKRLSPMQQHEQVINLVCGLAQIFRNVPVSKIQDFRRELVSFVFEQDEELCRHIDNQGTLQDADKERIVALARRFLDKKTGRCEPI